MWAPPARRTLLMLALRLLFLSPAAPGACPGNSQELLAQLWSQTNLLSDPEELLRPYIEVQGLAGSGLETGCRGRPAAFPGARELRALARPALLRTLSGGLGPVLRRLAALQREAPGEPAWARARGYLLGIRNNVHCLARLLPGAPGTTPEPEPEPTPTPTPAPNTFARKLEGCRLLAGFHRFMHAAAQVLAEWRGAPGPRSRRHSPRSPAQQSGARPRPRRARRQDKRRGQPPR